MKKDNVEPFRRRAVEELAKKHPELPRKIWEDAVDFAIGICSGIEREAFLAALRDGLSTVRVGGHLYVSTACHHERHAECRKTCKFCSSSCGCACHIAEATE